jgi:transcriptional regulator with XRE-family HTH domain/tetratricopeptide (TPR) repeat protein
MRTNALTVVRDGTPANGFGPLLKHLRGTRTPALSQSDLAERLGRSTSFVSLIESGQRQPTRDFIGRLAQALRLSQEEESQLVEAAGYPSDPVGVAVGEVVRALGDLGPLDAADREMMRADLAKVITAWRDLIVWKSALATGSLKDVRERLVELQDDAAVTPAIRLYGNKMLAEIDLRLGKLDNSSRLFEEVRAKLRQEADGAGELAHALSKTRADLMTAEILGKQGMIALDNGRFADARARFEESKAAYLELLLNVADDERGEVYAGLGWAYKQLAQMALYQGQPGEALEYCASAGANFLLAGPSPRQAEGRRRLLELEAWAYSSLKQFDRAIQLRQEARSACEEAGDTIGAIKSRLYLSDDYRDLIEARIDERRQSTGQIHVSPGVLIKTLRADGSLPDALLIEAERACEDAVRHCQRTDELRVLGRAYVNLAFIQRVQGRYADAKRALDLALVQERISGTRHRIPSVLVAFAELAWDQDRIAEAEERYAEALAALEKLGPHELDEAAKTRLRRRIQDAQGALRLRHETDALDDAELIDAAHLYSWTLKTTKLKKIVQDAILRHGAEPRSTTGRTVEWLEELCAIEEHPGPRILAQNRLSNALAAHLPPGYPPEDQALHQRRHEALRQNIMQAQERDLRGYYRDLCCRGTVESSLGEPAVRERVRGALDLLERFPAAYTPEASVYPLPVSFVVKGAHVWLERSGPMPSRAEPPDDASLALVETPVFCYHIEDADLADKLTEVFDDLIELAQHGAPGAPSAQLWLLRCREQEKSLPLSQPTSM